MPLTDFSRELAEGILSEYDTLESLNLSRNALVRVDNLFLLRPLGLRFLDLRWNRLVSLQGAGSLTSLEELYAGHNDLSLSSVLEVPSLPSLRVLDLSFNRLQKGEGGSQEEELRRVLDTHPSLEVLDVRGNEVASDSIAMEALRENLQTSGRIILVLSAHADGGRQEEALVKEKEEGELCTTHGGPSAIRSGSVLLTAQVGKRTRGEETGDDDEEEAAASRVRVQEQEEHDAAADSHFPPPDPRHTTGETGEVDEERKRGCRGVVAVSEGRKLAPSASGHPQVSPSHQPSLLHTHPCTDANKSNSPDDTLRQRPLPQVAAPAPPSPLHEPRSWLSGGRCEPSTDSWHVHGGNVGRGNENVRAAARSLSPPADTRGEGPRRQKRAEAVHDRSTDSPEPPRAVLHSPPTSRPPFTAPPRTHRDNEDAENLSARLRRHRAPLTVSPLPGFTVQSPGRVARLLFPDMASDNKDSPGSLPFPRELRPLLPMGRPEVEGGDIRTATGLGTWGGDRAEEKNSAVRSLAETAGLRLMVARQQVEIAELKEALHGRKQKEGLSPRPKGAQEGGRPTAKDGLIATLSREARVWREDALRLEVQKRAVEDAADGAVGAAREALARAAERIAEGRAEAAALRDLVEEGRMALRNAAEEKERLHLTCEELQEELLRSREDVALERRRTVGIREALEDAVRGFAAQQAQVEERAKRSLAKVGGRLAIVSARLRSLVEMGGKVRGWPSVDGLLWGGDEGSLGGEIIRGSPDGGDVSVSREVGEAAMEYPCEGCRQFATDMRRLARAVAHLRHERDSLRILLREAESAEADRLEDQRRAREEAERERESRDASIAGLREEISRLEGLLDAERESRSRDVEAVRKSAAESLSASAAEVETLKTRVASAEAETRDREETAAREASRHGEALRLALQQASDLRERVQQVELNLKGEELKRLRAEREVEIQSLIARTAKESVVLQQETQRHTPVRPFASSPPPRQPPHVAPPAEAAAEPLTHPSTIRAPDPPQDPSGCQSSQSRSQNLLEELRCLDEAARRLLNET
uniref:Uncharacterized protein n=1 Tax=Chromera velia CCMP2878 TaxID=1169474 RepID=A0A0G4GB67_9ALVE|eukprot:Cvel_21103.t1-p1 / transcript=Cvel_21103.t1 / gene=Cvel_21103 / organism=Chromera_velia_CCMP2878 / gene_product=hypothetical protein / transcript_product=hypothetical protein / location=Cvel_scaffold1952:2126-9237(+) / protein_length=1046 / sequence_SO=supercontig / SO=protein_coding / is_pseudo=false